MIIFKKHMAKFAVLLLFILDSVSCVYAQFPNFPEMKMPPNSINGKKYVLPKFVRRGLVVCYDAAGRIVGKKNSATTWLEIYIVNYVDNNKVIGTKLDINRNNYLITGNTFKTSTALGHFFISPDYIKELKIDPPPGVKVSGQIVTYKVDKNQMDFSFDSQGKIIGSKYVSNILPHPERYVAIFKWQGFISLPDLPVNFPPYALRRHIYETTSTMPDFMGRPQEVPIGQMTIIPTKVTGKIMEYVIQVQNKMEPVKNTKGYATTLWGIDFIHPDFLKSLNINSVVFSIPVAGYRQVVSYKDQNNIRIEDYLNNIPIAYSIYDIRSGIKTMSVIQKPWPGITIRLVQ